MTGKKRGDVAEEKSSKRRGAVADNDKMSLAAPGSPTPDSEVNELSRNPRANAPIGLEQKELYVHRIWAGTVPTGRREPGRCFRLRRTPVPAEGVSSVQSAK